MTNKSEKGQKLVYKFFLEVEKNKKSFTIKELSEHTKLAESTLATYIRKNFYKDFLKSCENNDKKYIIEGLTEIDFETFKNKVSQDHKNNEKVNIQKKNLLINIDIKDGDKSVDVNEVSIIVNGSRV